MNALRWLRAVFFRVAPAYGRALPWLGGALMAVAAGFGLHSWRFVRTQQRAIATVTENVESFAPGGGLRYSPRLRFRAEDGSLVQVQTSDYSDDVHFAAGDTLPVIYPSGAPQRAILATAWEAYRGAIVFGVLGVLVLDLGLILRLLMKRHERQLAG
jgi:hypothetical protein